MAEKTRNIWIVNGLLAVILALLGAFYIRNGATPAYAAGGGWETDGVMAMSAIGDGERLVLVDTGKQNIMVYKLLNKQFRLVGARSYKYDVEIEDSAGTPIEKSGTGATYMEVWNLYQDHLNKKAAGKTP